MPRISAQKTKGSRKVPLRKERVSTIARRKSPSFLNLLSKKKVLKRVLLSVALVFVSLAFLGSYIGYKYLTQNFASAQSNSSYSFKDDPYPTTSYIVVEKLDASTIKLTKLQYIIMDRETKKVMLFNIPLDLTVDAPGRFGEETLDRFFALGTLKDSEDYLKEGTEMMNSTLMKIFGFKVDRYVLVSQEFDDNFTKLWSKGQFFNLLKDETSENFRNSLYTSYNFQELYDVSTFVKSLPADRIIYKDINANDLVDTTFIDDLLTDITYNSVLVREGSSIAILNGTGYPGLASFGSRIVTNSGGRVVALGNATSTYEESYIVANDINSESVAYLSRTLNIKNIVSSSDTNLYENVMDRADITIVLGIDISKILY